MPLVHEVHQRAKGTRGVAKRRHRREIVVGGGFGIVRVRAVRLGCGGSRGGGGGVRSIAARVAVDATPFTVPRTTTRGGIAAGAIGSIGGTVGGIFGVLVPRVEVEDDVGGVPRGGFQRRGVSVGRARVNVRPAFHE